MPPRSELDKIRRNLEGAMRMLRAVAEDLATLQKMVEPEETPALDDFDPSADGCDTCGASLDDGEGYDGVCGPCADRREPREEDGHLEAAFEDRVNGGLDKGE
jgi:hypothetical protein